ncbi:MAG: hypothetical protein AAF222_09775 [Pseudomonadota bacterium]
MEKDFVVCGWKSEGLGTIDSGSVEVFAMRNFSNYRISLTNLKPSEEFHGKMRLGYIFVQSGEIEIQIMEEKITLDKDKFIRFKGGYYSVRSLSNDNILIFTVLEIPKGIKQN